MLNSVMPRSAISFGWEVRVSSLRLDFFAMSSNSEAIAEELALSTERDFSNFSQSLWVRGMLSLMDCADLRSPCRTPSLIFCSSNSAWGVWGEEARRQL